MDKRVVALLAVGAAVTAMSSGQDHSAAAAGDTDPATKRVLAHRAAPPDRPELAALLRGNNSKEKRTRSLEDWVEQQESDTGVLRTTAQSIDDLDAAQVQDLLFIAGDLQRDIAEVINDYGSQDHLLELDKNLKTTYPGVYAGMTLSQAQEPTVVTFNGAPPNQALRMVEGVPASIDVVYGDLLPEAEVQDWLDSIQRSLAPMTGLPQASFDSTAQRFEVVVPRSSTVSDQKIIDAIGVLPSGTALGPIARTLSDNEATADEDNVIRGGGSLNETGCTAGFVVRHRSTAAKLLSTAGHCPVSGGSTNESYQLRGVDGWTVTGMGYGNRIYFHEGSPDFAYLSIPSYRQPYPSVYITYSQKREVGAYYSSRLPKNTWVCHFGRTTEHSCAKVDSPSINLGRPGGSGAVAVHANVLAPGDSGGPWWRSQSAVGTHKGKVSSTDQRSVYSPVHMMKDFGNFAPWTT